LRYQSRIVFQRAGVDPSCIWKFCSGSDQASGESLKQNVPAVLGKVNITEAINRQWRHSRISGREDGRPSAGSNY
jgi:hypothetical protein